MQLIESIERASDLDIGELLCDGMSATHDRREHYDSHFNQW